MSDKNSNNGMFNPPVMNNQGLTMVANPSDRVEIVMEKGSVLRLTAPIRLDQPSDFSAWSERLFENLNRCPPPGILMLKSTPMQHFLKLMKKGGETVEKEKKWTFSDGTALETEGEIREAEHQKAKAEKYKEIFKDLDVDIGDEKRTTKHYVYTAPGYVGLVETKENRKCREGIRRWIQSCVSGGIYSYICENNQNDSACIDDVAGMYRRLRDIAEKPTHLDLVNLIDSLLKQRMANNDITTYMGKVLDSVKKINKMSKLIPQEEGEEIKLSREFGRILVLREAFLSPILKAEVEAQLRLDAKISVWKLVEAVHDKYRLQKGLSARDDIRLDDAQLHAIQTNVTAVGGAQGKPTTVLQGNENLVVRPLLDKVGMMIPGSRPELCYQWKETGLCKRGDKCAFQHPARNAAGRCFKCVENHDTATCSYKETCMYCGMQGHPAVKCRKKRFDDRKLKDHSRRQQSGKRKAKMAKLMQSDDDSEFSQGELRVLQVQDEVQQKLFQPRWEGGKKFVRFLTDSGANWTGYPDHNDLGNKSASSTQIVTAEAGGGFMISHTGSLTLKTRNGYQFPKQNRVLASEHINEPLLSAYRVCEAGYVIVLTKHGQEIYEDNGFKAMGKQVVKSPVDPISKQYAIDLEIVTDSENHANQKIPPGILRASAKTFYPELNENANELQRHVSFDPIIQTSEDDRQDEVSIGEIKLATTYYNNVASRDYLCWHSRLGHMSYASLDKIIPGLQGKEKLCGACAKAKIVFHPHKKTNPKNRVKLLPGEFISSDMDGPYERSPSGARYVDIFLDKASKVMHVKFLRTKDEHLQALKEVLAESKARTGRCCRYYKRDKDGSHSSRELEKFLVQEGIASLFSAGGDSKKNASVESRIRWLQESARANMMQSGASKKFTFEAFDHAVFTYNNVPSVPSSEKGQYLSKWQLFEETQSSFPLQKFHSFGCKVFCRLPDARIGQKSIANSRAFEGIMLGYSTKSEEYRIWDMDCQKMRLVSHNMCIFEEGHFPSKIDNSGNDFYPEIITVDITPENNQKVISKGEIAVTVPQPVVSEQIPEQKIQISQNENLISREITMKNSGKENLISHSEGEIKENSVKSQPNLRRSERIKAMQMVSEATEQIFDSTSPKMISHTLGKSDILAPIGRKQAQKRPDWIKFKEAEELEMKNLTALKTWEPWKDTDLPKGRKPIRLKWVYAIKTDPSTGAILKYKARLVVMGCFQQAGMDYFNIDASVMNLNGTRMTMAEWISDPENTMERWDVTAAFPNADIEEDIWVCQPPGYEHLTGGSGFVLKLKKALYGTKQAARAWQQKVRSIIESVGGSPILIDKATYVLKDDVGGWCVIPTHVDDFFPTFNKSGKYLRDKVWNAFSSQLEITNFGEANQMLGAVISYDRKAGILKLSHNAYVQEILEEFLDGFKDGTWTKRHTPGPTTGEDSSYDDDEATLDPDCYPIEIVVGKLWWTVHVCRADLYVHVAKIAKRVTKITKRLLRNIQWLLSYLATTIDFGITMVRGGPAKFTGAADAAWSDQTDSVEDIKMKSTLGWCLMYRNCLIGYGSKTSARLCGSSTEAECMAVVELARLNQFCRSFAELLNCWKVDLTPTIVWEDCSAAVKLSKPNAKIKRSRHFAISWYQVKEYQLEKEMILQAVSTDEQIADMMTKALPRKQFEILRNKLMGGFTEHIRLNMFQALPVSRKQHYTPPNRIYYAVVLGALPSSVGIYTSWAKCAPHVIGVHGAIYASFKTRTGVHRFFDEHGVAAVRRQDKFSEIAPVGEDFPCSAGDEKKNGVYPVLFLENGGARNIFFSWPECKKATAGKMAIYQKCKNEETAKEFFRQVQQEMELIRREQTTQYPSNEPQLYPSNEQPVPVQQLYLSTLPAEKHESPVPPSISPILKKIPSGGEKNEHETVEQKMDLQNVVGHLASLAMDNDFDRRVANCLKEKEKLVMEIRKLMEEAKLRIPKHEAWKKSYWGFML